jgi:hypothetical protein
MDKQNQNIDTLLRSLAGNAEVPYDEKAWQKMRTVLQQTEAEADKPNRRKKPLWLLLLLLLVPLAIFLLIKTKPAGNKNENKNIAVAGNKDQSPIVNRYAEPNDRPNTIADKKKTATTLKSSAVEGNNRVATDSSQKVPGPDQRQNFRRSTNSNIITQPNKSDEPVVNGNKIPSTQKKAIQFKNDHTTVTNNRTSFVGKKENRQEEWSPGTKGRDKKQ